MPKPISNTGRTLVVGAASKSYAEMLATASPGATLNDSTRTVRIAVDGGDIRVQLDGQAATSSSEKFFDTGVYEFSADEIVVSRFIRDGASDVNLRVTEYTK